MVILSAAVKSIPAELIESARLDGAGEVRLFFDVIIPSIRGTIITVATTVLIMVLKVFDIVYVMTNGRFETEVVANRMFNEMFKTGNYGHASALVMLLVAATIPVMLFNIRNLSAERR
jgi:alpha-glucoside transport system permease protein